MTKHDCTIVEDRYPTCSCGSGSWPCRTEKAEAGRATDEEVSE